MDPSRTMSLIEAVTNVVWHVIVKCAGQVRTTGGASRMVPALAFVGAPRLHDGGYLQPDEVPAMLQRGERALRRHEVADYQRGREVPVVLTFNVTTPDTSSFRRAQAQITAEMAAAIERARRNL